MSRRNSRSNPVENDTLAELENFKRKFLLMNKHITKMNSGLNTKVEELNSQLSQLYVENLRLRALNVSLNTQLKRERDKSQRVLLEAETAAAQFMNHMVNLRQVYNMPSAPSQAQQRQPKAQRPNTPPPARISRPPAFHQIREVNSSEEDDRTIALASGRPHSALSMHSRLPVPVSEGSSALDAPNPWHKKTSRRKSGFLEGLARPPSPSPGSPVTAQIKALSARMEDEGEDLDTEVEDINAAQDSLPDLPEMVNFHLSRDSMARGVTLPATDIGIPPTEAITSKPKPQSSTAKKATGLRRVGLLKDMTNTNTTPNPLDHAHTSPTLSDYTKPSGTTSNENARAAHVDTPALPAQSLPPMHSAAHSVPALSHYSMDDNMGDDTSASGRERRSRKSVNYAEPSLKVKMRKPDGAPSSKPKRKRSTTSRALINDDEETDGDAGAEGDAENDLSAATRLNGAVTSVRRRSVAVPSTLGPIEESRRHSIAT